MRSSISKLILNILWLALLAGCSSATANKDPMACAVDVIGKASFVKTDDTQKRFFIIREQADADSLRPVIAGIQACLADHPWSLDWSLSVFAEKRLAGYKDDAAIVPFHKNDRWAKGYLAEFDSKLGVLTLKPAVSPSTFRINAATRPHSQKDTNEVEGGAH